MPATNYTPGWHVDNFGGRLRVIYDFAVHGGAVGDIVVPDISLPNKAIIHSGYINVLTAPTSGGSATVALALGSTGTKTTIKSATAIASLTGLVALNSLPIQVANNAGGDLIVTVGVAALTAGKMEIWLGYDQPTA